MEDDSETPRPSAALVDHLRQVFLQAPCDVGYSTGLDGVINHAMRHARLEGQASVVNYLSNLIVTTH
mgnify:CR=1 FL=1